MTMLELITGNADILSKLLVYKESEPEVGFGDRWRSRLCSGVFLSEDEAIEATKNMLISAIPDIPDCGCTSADKEDEVTECTIEQHSTKSVWTREVVSDICPRCGAQQVKMYNTEKHYGFSGCSRYPDCSYHYYPPRPRLNVYFDGVDIDELDEDMPSMHADSMWGDL